MHKDADIDRDTNGMFKWNGPCPYLSDPHEGLLMTMVRCQRYKTSPAADTLPNKSKSQIKRGRPKSSTKRNKELKPTAFRISSREKPNSVIKK